MNAEKYIDILKKTLIPFDNDPNHTSRRAAGKTARPRGYCASVHIHDKCEITSQHPHFFAGILAERSEACNERSTCTCTMFS